MAARKLFPGPRPSHPELDRIRQETRDLRVTDEQWAEQQVSFTYGNAPAGSSITQESARAACAQFRIKGVIAEVCDVCAYPTDSDQHVNHCRS
jgi:hypothetical protein